MLREGVPQSDRGFVASIPNGANAGPTWKAAIAEALSGFFLGLLFQFDF